jgi:spore maturation protein CgeB
MLHERNEESVLYFKEGTEAGFFGDAEEMAKQVQYYLEHEQERLAVKEAGYQRALKEHSLDERARVVVHQLQKLGAG